MPGLRTIIQDNELRIREHVMLSDKYWRNVIGRVPTSDLTAEKELYDEQVWTFLLACGFALMGSHGVRILSTVLTGNNDLIVPDDHKIWLEALPLPPRIREGNTNLDLALGNIDRRNTGPDDTQRNRSGIGIQ